MATVGSDKVLSIHAGMPKCGSTSIQAFMKDFRDAINETGRLYVPVRPNVGMNSHVQLALEAGKSPKFRPEIYSWEKMRAELAPLAGGTTCLVSSESFSLFEASQTAAMTAEMPDWTPEILLYVRNQKDFLVSLYVQNVKGGLYAYGPDLGIRRLMQARHDYNQLAAHWIDVFGTDRVKFRDFSRAALEGGDVVVDYASLYGITELGVAFKESGASETNLRLSEEALTLLRHVLVTIGLTDDWRVMDENRRLITTPILHMIWKVIPEINTSSFQISEDFQRQIIDNFAEANRKFTSTFLPRFDEKSWFETSPPKSSQLVNPDLDKFEAALRRWVLKSPVELRDTHTDLAVRILATLPIETVDGVSVVDIAALRTALDASTGVGAVKKAPAPSDEAKAAAAARFAKGGTGTVVVQGEGVKRITELLEGPDPRQAVLPSLRLIESMREPRRPVFARAMRALQHSGYNRLVSLYGERALRAGFDDDPQIYWMMVKAHIDRGEIEAAKSLLAVALKHCPAHERLLRLAEAPLLQPGASPPEPRDTAAHTAEQLKTVQGLLSQNEVDGAALLVLEVLERAKPGQRGVYLAAVRTLLRAGLDGLTEVFAREALANGLEDEGAIHWALVRSLIALRRPDDAREALAAAQAKLPENKRIQELAAKALGEGGALFVDGAAAAEATSSAA